MKSIDTTHAKVAVLATCFNRRDSTVKMLNSLFEQNLPNGASVTVYLVDDGSTDGTSEAVRQNFPGVIILRGSGELYWNGGMWTAMSAAMEKDYDFYIWVNDDCVLEKNALDTLLTTYFSLKDRGPEKSIVVGSLRDPDTGDVSYGGVVRSSRWHPLRFEKIRPTDFAIECDAFHGNLVLIPECVVSVVGNLDPAFRHSFGDSDYGLRAGQMECKIWVAPDYLGDSRYSGSYNKGDYYRQDFGLPFKDLLKKLLGPKGLPIKERVIFMKRHAGAFWPIFWLVPYIKVFIHYFIFILQRPLRKPVTRRS